MEQNAMLELAKKFDQASTEDILELFNPANAQALPNEVLDLMQNLSDDRIKALAERYPNAPTGNTYLILKDNKVNKQLFTRSTWANLHGLRSNGGLSNFVALTFTTRFKGDAVSKPATVKYSDTQDLTKDEAKSLSGLKVAAPQTSQAENGANGSQNAQEAQGEAKLPLLDTTAQMEAGDNGEEFPELKHEATLSSFIDEGEGEENEEEGEGEELEIEGEEEDQKGEETKINTRKTAKKAATKKAAPKKAHGK